MTDTPSSIEREPSEPRPDHALDTAPPNHSFVLTIGSIMLVGLVALAWIGRPPRQEIIGERLPPLDLQALVNTERGIENADLDGKLTVLHFWGTWCHPCHLEFPEFAQLVAEFGELEDVAIVSVSCSSGPEFDMQRLTEQTHQFLQEQTDLDIPTYADSAAMTRQQLALMMPNGSFGYPTTLLVDREGVIVEALDGYLPGEMEKLAESIRERL